MTSHSQRETAGVHSPEFIAALVRRWIERNQSAAEIEVALGDKIRDTFNAREARLRATQAELRALVQSILDEAEFRTNSPSDGYARIIRLAAAHNITPERKDG